MSRVRDNEADLVPLRDEDEEETGEDGKKLIPTYYYGYKNLPGPGTGIVKTNKEGEVTGKYTAWNQIPYEPPIKKIPVNYYGEPVVQKQPVPTTKNRKQLEEEEEKGRHNLYSSYLNRGLPTEIPKHLVELNVSNTVLIKRGRDNEKGHKYSILNKTADKTFWWAEEDSSTFGRLVHGQMRYFKMIFRDQEGEVVVRMERPFKLGCSCCTMLSCCLCCQRQKIDVESPPTNFLGAIREERSWSSSENLLVYNTEDDPVLKIVGPAGGFVNFGMTHYPIYSLARQNLEIGRIIRQASGPTTVAGYDYTLQYPLNIRPELKLVILSAAILIDYMYYE